MTGRGTSPRARARTIADTIGIGGRYRDPLWRIEVTLTPLEQRLLSTWWVRRLGLIAHAGAASLVTTQTYTRLEHSLGVLALVAHFDPDDTSARTAALLHDIGHLPLSHTIEGVAGLDHHRLGAQRIGELGPLLRAYGGDPDHLVEVVDGRVPSALSGRHPGLRLDHLDSFLRSGQAHGRLDEPAARLLPGLGLVDGVVDADPDAARRLVTLIAAEARAQSDPVNLVATAVVRDLAQRLLTDADRERVEEVAAMTDAEFVAALLVDPRTGATLRRFLRHPDAWSVVREDRPGPVIRFRLRRRYLDLPTRDGRPMTAEVLPDDLREELAEDLIAELTERQHW